MRVRRPYDTAGEAEAAPGAAWFNHAPSIGQAGSVPMHESWTEPAEEIGHFIDKHLGDGSPESGQDPDDLEQLDKAFVAAGSLLMPIGTVLLYAGSTPPDTFLELNGATVLRADFPDLWAWAQTSGRILASDTGAFTVGDGATTFRLPFANGEFPRFWDNGRGVNPGRALGGYEGDAMIDHTHACSNSGNFFYRTTGPAGSGSLEYATAAGTRDVGSYQPASTGGVDDFARLGTEVRPRNIAFLPIIKAWHK